MSLHGGPLPPRPALPPFPAGCPARFRATLHGTVFAGREARIAAVDEGDRLLLVPDPPGQDDPQVWIHLATGDILGHLPPEIAAWLAPWLQAGGAARATAARVRGRDSPSWRRVVVEVTCAVSEGGDAQ